MATIYDVAALAKVSAKTVSRVLNGDAPVSRETREAIEAAIAELGFVPSNAARMMRSQRSGLIGLITGAISMSPEPTQPAGLPELFIVQGIQRALEPSGMTVMIADTGGRCGFKAAGGIRTPEEAARYFAIAERLLGTLWVTPARLRIGASRRK